MASLKDQSLDNYLENLGLDRISNTNLLILKGAFYACDRDYNVKTQNPSSKVIIF